MFPKRYQWDTCTHKVKSGNYAMLGMALNFEATRLSDGEESIVLAD